MNDESVQRVLNKVDRAAWVITSRSSDRTGGLVATFVTNASLVPALPRIVAGIARHHHTWDLIARSRSFAAHLVDEEHIDLIWRFGLASGHSIDKFAGVKWRPGQTGSPLLEDAVGWLDCSVEAELDIGDRSIFVGAVVDGGLITDGAIVTANRLLQLATVEQRERMEKDRYRDQQVDAAAMLAWRARRARE